MKTMQHDNADRKYSFWLCPVPLRQQPVNQYRELRERNFFRWVVLDRPIYCTKLLAVWITGMLLTLYAITIRSDRSGITVSDFLGSAIAGEVAVLFSVIMLYAAWNYVHSRLISLKINYKISSGEFQSWRKPKSVLMRDSLVARFQVRPILERIKQTIIFSLLLFMVNLLTLFLVINS